jgi:glycosyltransferase involved in cell wall biosynthesis
LNILLVNNSEIGGGGEKIVNVLFTEFLNRGINTTLFVGEKRSTDNNIYQISKPEDGTNNQKLWLIINRIFTNLPFQTFHNPRYLSLLQTLITRTPYFFDSFKGYDLLPYPSSYKLLDTCSNKPDIIHLHNLHEDYFDIRAIPDLSKKVPLFITLHDFWLITGYCASFFSCMNWKDGCKDCILRSRIGANFREAFHHNWLIKKEIFSKSQIYLICPSKWTQNIIENSILKSAIKECRIIPHGINTNLFSIGKKEAARNIHNLPLNTHILLMTSRGGFDNQKFDWDFLKKTLQIISQNIANKKILLLILGGLNRMNKIGNIILQEIPFKNDVKSIVEYYQAADLYIHTSKDETFGMSILEAMSCGLPVITTNIGALSELIEDKKSGLLIPKNDAKKMADGIIHLLNDHGMYDMISHESRERVLNKYSIEVMIDSHIKYYQDVLKN